MLLFPLTPPEVGQMQTDTKTSVMLCGSFCHVTSQLLKTSSLTPPDEYLLENLLIYAELKCTTVETFSIGSQQ